MKCPYCGKSNIRRGPGGLLFCQDCETQIDEDEPDLPVIIRRARRAKEYTQEQVARHLGYTHRNQIHKLETGLTELKARDLIRLARILDIDLNALKNS